jgi:hypothetical protein
MKTAYRVLAGLICLGVLVQAASVAVGWFGVLSDVDGGAVLDKNYDGNVGHMIHGIVGTMVMPLLALILLVVSFFTKVPGAVKLAGLTLLAVVAQVILAFISFGVPAIGALHGLNAFVIFGVALLAVRRVTAATLSTGTSTPAQTAAV